MSDFITLSCPSCGGKLEISSDIQRFVCLHCGNEHSVRRGGGLIALVPVLQTLHNIQQGTDRTADELRLRRLLDEVSAADKESERLIWSVLKRDYLRAVTSLRSIGKLDSRDYKECTSRYPLDLPGRIIVSLTIEELRDFLIAYKGFPLMMPSARRYGIEDIKGLIQSREAAMAQRPEIDKLKSRL